MGSEYRGVYDNVSAAEYLSISTRKLNDLVNAGRIWQTFLPDITHPRYTPRDLDKYIESESSVNSLTLRSANLVDSGETGVKYQELKRFNAEHRGAYDYEAAARFLTDTTGEPHDVLTVKKLQRIKKLNHVRLPQNTKPVFLRGELIRYINSIT